MKKLLKELEKLDIETWNDIDYEIDIGDFMSRNYELDCIQGYVQRAIEQRDWKLLMTTPDPIAAVYINGDYWEGQGNTLSESVLIAYIKTLTAQQFVKA